jgi:hypothetical protein
LTPEKGPSEFFKLFFTKVLYHGAKKRQVKPLICRDLRCFFEVIKKSELVYAHKSNAHDADPYHFRISLLFLCLRVSMNPTDVMDLDHFRPFLGYSSRLFFSPPNARFPDKILDGTLGWFAKSREKNAQRRQSECHTTHHQDTRRSESDYPGGKLLGVTYSTRYGLRSWDPPKMSNAIPAFGNRATQGRDQRYK